MIYNPATWNLFKETTTQMFSAALCIPIQIAINQDVYWRVS